MAVAKPKPPEKPPVDYRCPVHPEEMLLDELKGSQVLSLSLCKVCDDIVIEDAVRGLWRKR